MVWFEKSDLCYIADMLVCKLTRGWELHCTSDSRPMLWGPNPGGLPMMIPVSPLNKLKVEWRNRLREVAGSKESQFMSYEKRTALKATYIIWNH